MEKLEKNIVKGNKKCDYEPDPRGLGHVFFSKMLEHKSNIAQVDAISGKEETYGSLLQRSIRTALEMRIRGVTEKDFITVCSLNHLDCCVPFIAALFLGATVAPIDSTLSAAEVQHLLHKVKPKMIFVSQEATNLIGSAVQALSLEVDIVVFGSTDIYSSFSEFLFPKCGEDVFQAVALANCHDTAVIFFSSGTTGFPKGICNSHYALLGRAVQSCTFGICYDVTIVFSSIYTISAGLHLIIGIICGARRIVTPQFDADTAWNLLQDHKVTFTFIAPCQILAMYHSGRPNDCDTSALSCIIVGGGPISKPQLEKCKTMFPGTCVCVAYGQTETGGHITTFNIGDENELALLDMYPNAVGLPIPEMFYKIVDTETEEILGPNCSGEICLKTKFVMNGYFDEDSSAVWDSEGWYKTGDIGYYNENFCFYIVDRVKDMIKYRSRHVSPGVIENILLTHPLVESAVVVGIPHEEDGDHPLAFVVLKQSAINIIPKDIEKYVEETGTDRQQLRGGVIIIDHIPMTPTGKIKRKLLRDKFLLNDLYH